MKRLGWLIFVAGALVALFGILVLIVQAADWLNTGQWRAAGMGLFIGEKPSTTMVGLQKIIDWFWGFPAVVGIPFIGVMVASFGLKIVEWAKPS
jgi:hypothetical protein